MKIRKQHNLAPLPDILRVILRVIFSCASCPNRLSSSAIAASVLPSKSAPVFLRPAPDCPRLSRERRFPGGFPAKFTVYFGNLSVDLFFLDLQGFQG